MTTPSAGVVLADLERCRKAETSMQRTRKVLVTPSEGERRSDATS